MSDTTAIPLSVPCIKGNAWKYVKDCLDTGWVSAAGKYVGVFERKICGYTKAKHAVAVSNGSVGLYISLKLCGVKQGDEVLVPTLTFIAPINAVKHLGAEPVFMDCDNFLNLDPIKLGDFLENQCRTGRSGVFNRKTGRQIKAILPVHVFGNPCDMAAIMRLARKHRLKVVEDATESLGSYYTGGPCKNRFTGTIGDFGVYSFNGNKIITTGGGGVIVTGSKLMADRAKYLTTQAKDDPVHYVHNEIGYNFRLTNLQAALGTAQMEQLPAFIEAKKKNYRGYAEHLRGIDGLTFLGVPERTKPNYWFYSVLVDKALCGRDREGLMAGLKRAGVQTRPVWLLNHLQKPYSRNQAYKIDRALWFWQRTLNLPCSVSLTDAEVRRVCGLLRKLCRR